MPDGALERPLGVEPWLAVQYQNRFLAWREKTRDAVVCLLLLEGASSWFERYAKCNI
jgi:hypothetical protein